ncbi:MAG: HAD-IIIA family hydrolase [Clostridiaceae bacterium]
MKIAFLDRDGTINKDYPDQEWSAVKAPEILDGAIGAMRYFLAAGYKIIIVTNQHTIGEGIISLEDYHRFTELLLDILKSHGIDVLDVLFCPHRSDEHCACRKPEPGMIDAACQKYPEIEMNRSFLVGDSVADMDLAKNRGIDFYGIDLDCKNRINRLSDMIDIL